MLDIIVTSGWIGWVTVVLAIVALGLFIERVLVFRRESTRMDEFSKKFSEAVQQQQWQQAAQICDDHSGHIPEVYRLAVEHRALGPATLRGILANHIDLTIVPRLRARIGALTTIARGAPMLGLLGTVIGMIGAFSTIAGAE